MDYSVLPFFKSQYSLGRSILTLALPPEEKVEKGVEPDSIFEILEDNDMGEFFLVDDGLNGFLEAQLNAKKLGKKLMFGVRITILPDANIKNEASRENESKVIVFCHNKKGYQELIKLWSKASQDGFYYIPRTDETVLKDLDRTNLSLVVPFYDSFLYRNNFECASCIPSFLTLFNDVSFAIEDNDLPVDDKLKGIVEGYAKDLGRDTIKTQSIYYKERSDYLAYLTFRAIQNRSSLSKPNLDHMCSNEFCFESWKEKNG